MLRLLPIGLLTSLSIVLSGCGGGQNTDYFGLKMEATGNGGYYASRMDAVTQTADGGMLAAGKSNDDLWLIKLNPNGTVAWQNTYIQVFSVYRGMVGLSDGAQAIAGKTINGETFLLVIEANGAVRSLRTYPGFDFTNFQKASNGFHVMGSMDGSAALMHLDNAGNILRQAFYSQMETLVALASLPNGDLVVAGNRGNEFDDVGRVDIGLLKLTSQWQVSASRFYARNNTRLDIAGLYLNPNQQLVLGGTLQNGHFADTAYSERPYTLTINQNLDFVGAQAYSFNKFARIYDMTSLADGSTVMIGEFSTSDSDFSQKRASMIKLNATGAIAWKKSYAFPSSLGEIPADLTKTTKGFLFAGMYTDRSDYGFTISTNESGIIENTRMNVSDIPNGNISNIALDTYNTSVTRQNLPLEAILHQAPIPRATTSNLTRY